MIIRMGQYKGIGASVGINSIKSGAQSINME